MKTFTIAVMPLTESSAGVTLPEIAVVHLWPEDGALIQRLAMMVRENGLHQVEKKVPDYAVTWVLSALKYQATPFVSESNVMWSRNTRLVVSADSFYFGCQSRRDNLVLQSGPLPLEAFASAMRMDFDGHTIDPGILGGIGDQNIQPIRH